MSVAVEAPFCVATHNGTITIKSHRTGEHRTVRIRTEEWAVKDAQGSPVLDDQGNPKTRCVRVAQLLCGPDNTSDYRSFAFVDGDVVTLWRKHQDSKFYRWLSAFLSHPATFLNQVDVCFDGACRRCNRALTTPESVASGIGPICATLE